MGRAVNETPTRRPERPHTILVVDDSEVCREIATLQLREMGFEVISVQDPKMLVDAVRAARPSLALVDVNMPKLSGPALVATIRRAGELTCPIVLHSDNDESTLATLAKQCGADGFIQKTANVERMGKVIRGFLSRVPASTRGTNL